LRLAFRDIQTSGKAYETLGYYDELSFEGALISVDHECPADRTISYCAASMDLFFYGDTSGEPGDEGAKMGYGGAGSQAITGGIYIPFEIADLLRRATLFRSVVLVVNCLIVLFMLYVRFEARQKQRKTHKHAEPT